jgi:hypothetical protein
MQSVAAINHRECSASVAAITPRECSASKQSDAVKGRQKRKLLAYVDTFRVQRIAIRGFLYIVIVDSFDLLSNNLAPFQFSWVV